MFKDIEPNSKTKKLLRAKYARGKSDTYRPYNGQEPDDYVNQVMRKINNSKKKNSILNPDHKQWF